IVERFMVCLHHGAFTAVALHGIRHAPIRSILLAMGLHFVGNFPLALMAWNVGGLGRQVWLVIVQVWLLLFFLAMMTLLSALLHFADPERWRGFGQYLFGKAKCPECGVVYGRSIFAFNLGSHRYERCPGC